MNGISTQADISGAETKELWHSAPVELVLQELRTGSEGLSPAEARERLQVLGPNTLPRAASESVLTLLWRQVNAPLIYVLLGAALLALVMGKTIDGLVVLSVVVVNALIGFVQEYRAGRAIEALLDFVPLNATVIRAGQRYSVPAAELVPGDVVALQSGDKVPADLRLLAGRNLKIDEAILTGESLAAEKAPGIALVDAPLGDRLNLAFGGTLVTYGTGTGVVVATGAGTELGRISSLLNETAPLETPLTRQLATIGRWITVGILVVAALLLAVGLFRGYPTVDALLAAITLAVGAIPEGLPAIVTIALAIGVQRMAGRRAIIRRLPAVETLGSTTIICSDKTGTLTRNEMTVQALWTAEAAYELSGVGYEPVGELSQGERIHESAPEDVAGLLRGGALCNDAELLRESDSWRITGDPTEAALLVAAYKAHPRAEQLREQYPRLDVEPFESERQFMATLHATPEGGRVLYLKGAPEVVLARCATGVGSRNLNRAAVLGAVEELAGKGLRVLALAVRQMDSGAARLTDDDLEGGFEFLGLQGMIDPPRPEAIRAIQRCLEAGITVKMITGDHRTTAQAIGTKLGLLRPGETAVSGAELAKMSDEEISGVAAKVNVFARVAPEHKLRLVTALQERGEIVAMTGDGVNDAPALKRANIGIAMGITGTAVTKEASDMVLADDNFASIAAAVEEGRRVYDNLIKSLAFVLPTNVGLALILFVAVLLFPIVDGTPLLPMSPTQILWINLVATVALALPLAFEAMEPNLMQRPPRAPAAPILSGFLVLRTAIVALLMAAGALGLFLYEYTVEVGRGVAPDIALREAQTMAVTTVILFQVFYLINCRSLRDSVLRIGLWSNPAVYIGIAALLVLQAAFIYAPVMNAVFGTAPLNGDALTKSALTASVVLVVITIEKAGRQRTERPGRARVRVRPIE